MKIAILNGSPKGENSVTIQYVEYLKRRNPDDIFEIFHVGLKIKKYETKEALDELMERIILADLLLFVYPVYTFLAPHQLARFIALMKAHESAPKLKGKFASQITTSMHFYDFTAHRYINENIIDLGMKVIEGHSAEMEDLLIKKGQKQLKDFYLRVKHSIDNNLSYYTLQQKPQKHEFIFSSITNSENNSPENQADTVIVTDCAPDDSGLRSMINEFISIHPLPVKLVNINEHSIKGGCLGCFRCAATGNCIYNDDFQNLLRNEIQTSHAIIYAFSIMDHSMGSSFKKYDDRQFCNGHRAVIRGVYTGYIVHGRLKDERNLHDVMESRSEVSETHLAGIACDESCDNNLTAQSIKNLSLNLTYALENKWDKPQNFYGIGGMKIFRDLIYLMRGLMQADHRFYKKQDLYNFPHKRKGRIMLMYLAGTMMRFPSLQKKYAHKMTEGMLYPYKKVL